VGHRRSTGRGPWAALGNHELACGQFHDALGVRFSALGGTRIPNLLIRSKIALSAVPTSGSAGQELAKQGKLDAIAKPQVRGPVTSVLRRLNPLASFKRVAISES
jgi:hypothetical protein